MNWRRGRIVFRPSNLLCVMFLLLVVSAANASPTIPQQDIVSAAKASPTDIPTSPSRSVPDIVGPMDAQLVNLGREFLQPPPASAALSSTQGNLVKALPAIPATVFMALTGFLCVSLYRDRRVWLAGLAGLLWVAQAGIQAVPQLALRLSHRNHSRQQLDTELTYPYYLENSHRLRCALEGTRYIGLLHYLAGIPDSTISFPQPRLSFLRKQESRKVTTQLCCRSSNPSKNTISFSSPSATISEQYSLNVLFKCLATKAEQFICFSPAFIFETIPRGPPDFK